MEHLHRGKGVRARERAGGGGVGEEIYIYIDKASSYLVHIQAKTSFDWPII